MPEFNIVVPHLVQTTFKVEANTWQEAVDLASNHVDERGFQNVGAFRVLDADKNPVDTFQAPEPFLFVIEVKCLVDDDDLDEDDTDSEDGGDSIGGTYLIGIPAEAEDPGEAALDYFHNHIAIATLDNYDINHRELTDDDDVDLMQPI